MMHLNDAQTTLLCSTLFIVCVCVCQSHHHHPLLNSILLYTTSPLLQPLALAQLQIKEGRIVGGGDDDQHKEKSRRKEQCVVQREREISQIPQVEDKQKKKSSLLDSHRPSISLPPPLKPPHEKERKKWSAIQLTRERGREL